MPEEPATVTSNEEECVPCENNSIIQVSDTICRILSDKETKTKCDELKEKAAIQEITIKDYIKEVSNLIKGKDEIASSILTELESKIKEIKNE